MKIKTIKKWCCNAMSGGLLAVLPMFFLFSIVGTELNAQQYDRPYPDAAYGTTIEFIKNEKISLREELNTTDDPEVNILLMEYYMEVLGAFQNGELFHDAFIDKLLVFFTSEYSNTNSPLHNTIFENSVRGSNVSSVMNDPGGQVDPSIPVDPAGHYGGLNETFLQLVTAIHNTNGSESAFNELFNFINSNK